MYKARKLTEANKAYVKDSRGYLYKRVKMLSPAHKMIII